MSFFKMLGMAAETFVVVRAMQTGSDMEHDEAAQRASDESN